MSDLESAESTDAAPLISDAALRAILSALGTAPSFRECMRECALTLHQWTHADGATVFRTSSDGKELEQIHSVGFPGRLTQLSRRLSLRNSLTGLAVSQRELILSDSVAMDERVPKTYRDDLAADGFLTLIALPLLMHAEVVGAITLGWRQKLRLNAHDRDMLMNIGYGIAIAVDHDLREFESTRDGLTGLLNRRAFDERFAELVQACQLAGSQMSLIVMDLDDFKRCNDVHGHLVGDEVLRQTARTLSQQLLLERAVAFRIGGEEFVLLLPNADAQYATTLGEKICEAVGTNLFQGKDNQPFSVTLSAGVAQYDSATGETLAEFYGRADRAMYQAKRAGKNRVVNMQSGSQDG